MGLWVSMGWQASVLGIRIGVIEDIASALIPGWSALRIVNRFGIICWLAICVLAAVPFARDVQWLGSFRISRRVLGVAAIVSLLVSAARLDLRTEPSPEIATDLTPYHWLAENGEGDPLLEWPMRFADRNSRYMYLSTMHWLPLVNGYSGYIPHSQELMTSLVQGLPEAEAMRSLIELNAARWLLLHLRAPDYALRPWHQLRQEGVKLRAEGEDFQLYELPYRKDEPPLLRNGKGQEASIFGVRRSPLTRRDLRAEVVPFRKRVIDRVWMGLPVPLHIRNMGTVTWPGVAVTEAGLVGVIFRIRAAGESDYRWTRGFNRLPTDLAPGQATTVWPIVYSPGKPGDYDLVPCLTQVGVELTRCFEGAIIHLRIPEG